MTDVSAERLDLAERLAEASWVETAARLDTLEEALGLLGPPTIVRWAAACAERALPVWEQECPDDPRPRRAVEAARAWASCPCEEHRAAALDAAYAVGRATVVAATAAASWAADAAAAAGYAVGYAAADAAYAADAAAAANADTVGERAWQVLHLRRALLDPRVKS